MDALEQLGTLVINVNQDNLQDIFVIEEGMDQLMEGLIDSNDLPLDVWDALTSMRARLDDLLHRNINLPSYINTVTPETHQPTSMTTTS